MRRYAASFRRESDVLTLLDPADANEQNENDWPEFQLVDAEVKDAHGTMVSALTASYANLLTLTGILRLKSAGDNISEFGSSSPSIPG
jgi:hypothetical protein